MTGTFLNRVLATVTAAVALTASAVGGNEGPIAPIAQTRTLSSFVIVPPCGQPATVSDNETVTNFLPFDSAVLAERICDFAQGIATADQQSIITAEELSAAGSANAQAAAAPTTVIHSITSSVYQVTFQLAASTRFRLSGDLSAGGGFPAIVNASARLEHSGGPVIHHVAAAPGPGGATTMLKISQIVELEPGTYVLRASASSFIDAQIPPVGDGTSTYNITFTPLNAADLDANGVVDGIDLGILLSQWFAPRGGSADLNGDGVVDGVDLGILLSNWTF